MQTRYFSTSTACWSISISKCFKQKWSSLKIDLISNFECNSAKNNAFLNPSSAVQKEKKELLGFKFIAIILNKGG